jgi:hypothetical protein
MIIRSAYSPLLFLLGFALAAGLAGIALWNMVDAGPFRWHILQPRFRQGLIEILVLATISTAATRYWRKHGLWLALGAIAFYARRQNIDYSLALVVVYSAGIIATGEIARRTLGLHRPETGASLSRIVEAFVLGVTFFALAQWLVALTGIGFLGTIVTGWALALGALAGYMAIAYTNHEPSRLHQSITQGLATFRADSFIAFVSYFLILLGLSAIAKTNYAIDSDSLWYGLRPDRVLFHGGGLFSPSNLSPQVYYYPKLYEVLVTPLSRSGDISSIAAFGVACWAGFLLSSAALASLITSDRRLIIAFALMAGSTPAMIGIAPTAKGDLLAAALTVAGLVKLVEFNRTGNLRFAVLSAASLIIAPLVRMAVLPYVAIVSCCLLASYGIALWTRSVAADSPPHRQRRLWLVVIAATVVFLLVSLRTYKLTGLPFITPGSLQHLFEGMGFNIHFPATGSVDWSAVPIPPLGGVVFDFLFAPAALPHVVLGWTGNVWALLAVVGIAGLAVKGWRPKLTRNDYLFGALLIATGGLFFIILASQNLGIRGGDGNYFIVPITALLAIGLLLCRRLPVAAIKGLSLGSGLVSAAIFMMANGLWWTGTNEFDFNLARDPLDGEQFQNQKFSNGGMLEVFEATKECGADIAAVGALARPNAYLLPYRYEALTEIAWAPAFVESPRALANYLRDTGVDLLLLPREGSADRFLSPKFIGSPALYKRALEAAALLMQARGNANPQDIGSYRIWALTDAGSACLKTPPLTAVPSPPLSRTNTNDSRENGTPAEPTHKNAAIALWSDSAGVCDRSSPISVHWSIDDPLIRQVRIFVVDQSGTEVLFAAGGKSGSRPGKWIRAGNKFVMRDLASGHSIATHTVEAASCPGRAGAN